MKNSQDYHDYSDQREVLDTPGRVHDFMNWFFESRYYWPFMLVMSGICAVLVWEIFR